MNLPLFWIDAFTDRPFGGNPAAVVPLDRWIDDALMQKIAFEHGLSETAFFVQSGESRFYLRWFTPAVEVDLCGHATLASAHAIFHELGHKSRLITFDSRSGPLTVARRPDGKLELDFPATPPAALADARTERVVIEALGVTPQWLGETKFDLFAVLPDTATVERVRPDFPRVAAVGRRGIIVTAADGIDCDFVSRFFAPQSGVAEDPVTGSAHSALAPYWAGHLGKSKLHARQISRRRGELWCELTGDRVKIAGHGVLYLRGVIEI